MQAKIKQLPPLILSMSHNLIYSVCRPGAIYVIESFQSYVIKIVSKLCH